MLISKNILQEQLCSLCKKYLSVGPIKVYPNRQVKCGRCFEDNDNGIESRLYLTIVQNMLFPCINKLEGCDEQFTISEMKEHERQCKEGKYTCPICETFEGSVFLLNMHCINVHKGERLLYMFFQINLDNGNQQGRHFYQQDELFLFIDFGYEVDLQKIMVNISLPGRKYCYDILQSFTLCSVKHKTIFKTNEVLCSELDSTQRGFTIDISNFKSLENPLLCKFDVVKKELPTINKKLFIIDHKSDNFFVKCTFNNISKMTLGQEQFFPAIYNFLDIPWQIHITITTVANKSWLTVYLKWYLFQNYYPSIKSCRVNATFTLLSSADNLNASRQFPNLQYMEEKSWGAYLKQFPEVMKPSNGYIQHDSITITIQAKIYPLSIYNNDKCKECQIHCQQ